jgi:hypothetical protein
LNKELFFKKLSKFIITITITVGLNLVKAAISNATGLDLGIDLGNTGLPETTFPIGNGVPIETTLGNVEVGLLGESSLEIGLLGEPSLEGNSSGRFTAR